MMKKILLIAVMSVVGSSLCLGNIVQNGGFESQGSVSSEAEYWEWNNPNEHGSTWGTASREQWRSHSGTWEAVIGGTWKGDVCGGWWQERSAQPGGTYSCSAWFWADTTWTNQDDQGIKLEFWSGTESAETLMGAVTNLFSDISDTWVEKTVQGIAPSGTEWVRVVIYADNVGSQGALQFDDVTVTAEPGTIIMISSIPFWVLAFIAVPAVLRKKFLRKHN